MTMKHFAAYLIPVAVFVVQAVQAQDTVLPVSISDHKNHIVYRTVTSSCLIDEVEVVVGIEHTYAADVTVTVAHPDGTEVTLINKQGTGNNYKKDELIFYRKSVGKALIDSDGSTIGTQTIKVENLAEFDGKVSDGLWVVKVRDSAPGDEGFIDHVEIKVCDEVDNTSVSQGGLDSSSSSGELGSGSGFTTIGSSGEEGLNLLPSVDDPSSGESGSDIFPTGTDDIPSSTFNDDPSSGELGSDLLPPGTGDIPSSSLNDDPSSGESASDLLPPDSDDTPTSTFTDDPSSGEWGSNLLPPGTDDIPPSTFNDDPTSGESGMDLLPPGSDDIPSSTLNNDSSGGESGLNLPPALDDNSLTVGDDSVQGTDTLATTRSSSLGGGGGDPHFKTWTNIKYDYHGECDLVLVDNPLFAEGRGLRLHIRTIRKGYFSFIERAALRIGEDTLEFVNRKEWSINGEIPMTGKKASLGGYPVYKFHKALSVRLGGETKAKIDFMDRNNGMPYIAVDGSSSDIFKGSLGMIGDYASGMMIARDGISLIEDPESFALEWQVRDTEPLLFTTARAPQFPVQCTPPKKMMGNRLGSSSMKKLAEKACASWGDDKDECIFDVMATRDIAAAEAPMVID